LAASDTNLFWRDIVVVPFAGFVDPVTWQATGTTHIRNDDTAGRDGEEEEPQPEHPSPPLTLRAA
jgi:hypothetical protein